MSAEPEQVFLTDGIRFIGPYVVGSFDIGRGTRTLRETLGATDVYAVKGTTLLEAKAAWAKTPRKDRES